MPVPTKAKGLAEADLRPQSRSVLDHRRRRLFQILEREARGTQTIRGVKSLPSLPVASSASTLVECPSPLLVKSTPNLSPLRTDRSPIRQIKARTTRLVNVEPSPRIHQHTDQTPSRRILDEEVERPLSTRQFESIEKSHAQQLAKELKNTQLEQAQNKRTRQLERKIDAQADAEVMDWERTQLALMDQARRTEKQKELLDLRESQLHSLEIHRSQASATKIIQHFFDRLAVLDPFSAIEMFESKQSELIRCCVGLLGPSTEQRELENFEEKLRSALRREEKLLRHRVHAAQREEEVNRIKQSEVAELKKAQYSDILRHLASKVEERRRESTLRNELAAQQEVLDRRYQATQILKKHRNLDLSLRLKEQVLRNESEQKTVSLRLDGKSNPALWTPYWTEETIDVFDEADRVRKSDMSPPERQQIFAKKKCQWYD